MQLNIVSLGLFLLLSLAKLHAQPMIRSIKNNSPFLFHVALHNDMSDCSDFNLGKLVEIQPFSVYEHPFLLGHEKPGLLLRPVGYYDKKSNIYYSFLNVQGEPDRANLEKAFHAWKKHNKYQRGLDAWLTEWLCGDISLIHNHVEFLGYLSNEEMTVIQNNKNFHSCVINYSEGLFSRLFLDITIEQKKNKGIIPYVKSFVGQGGFCQDGKIVAIG